MAVQTTRDRPAKAGFHNKIKEKRTPRIPSHSKLPEPGIPKFPLSSEMPIVVMDRNKTTNPTKRGRVVMEMVGS